MNENELRRELFSMCRKFGGHYSIAEWLQTACNYINKRTERMNWEDQVGERMMRDVVEKM